MKFKIKINSFDWKIEKFICKNINLKPPESYAKINKYKLDELYFMIINKFSLLNNELLKEIILSINANNMRNYILNNHSRIIKLQNKIINDYNNNPNILDLVKLYDGSPLNLLRIIFFKKYKVKMTNIIKNLSILSPIDKTQLDIAIANDAYALVNQDEILKNSIDFEKKIENILIKKNIKFKTQEELANEQKKLEGFVSNTPDFLILDEFYINGIKINWIDAKNFYGINLKFIIKKIKFQTKKYIDKWGTGAIVFNLGFNSKLNFTDILLIDYESFKDI